MLKNIKSIVRMFPDFEEKIDFLFLADETFRDLCSDYILCADTARDMKNDLNKYRKQLEEYEDLQRNLEKEILKEILKNNIIP